MPSFVDIAYFAVPSIVLLYLVYRKMAKQGSPFFKIGYFLYTRTKVGYFYHRRELSKARRKYENGHSRTSPAEFDGLRIIPIPIILDNYSYLIVDDRQGVGVLVDPADPDVIQPVVQAQNIRLAAVLCTHKHWDHAGGNGTFRQLYRDLPVYGGAVDHAQDVTNAVVDGDDLTFGGLKFRVSFTPGHTVGHVVYLLDGAEFCAPNSLFSGDHLFLGGCGRMFEGSPTTMLRSLDVLSRMKDDTLVWPGHEYATDNLEYCAHIEPENEITATKQRWVKEQRQHRLSTCPSTIGEEKRYNVFLRSGEPSVIEAVAAGTDLQGDSMRTYVLGQLRDRKDKFKYKL